ncbi:MAG: NTP transferase domain-containing protein [Chloroflexi bacterium]|nr:NTP transferase domain-containing protein [Chloroflexota bacterium]
MFEHYYAVIMAGGEGSRLWPLSRQSRPKQMIRLGLEKTLFQIAVERLTDLVPADHIYVVTVAAQAEVLQKQSPEIPEENYLIEPMPRGTASVVGLAALALKNRDPQAVMAIVTADHLIQDVKTFHRLLTDAYTLAGDGYLVTLGIRPTYPATGYGYIQRGARLDSYPFLAFDVRRFKEKPDEETARQFVESGDHDWNSGMFIWQVDRIWDEFKRLMPDLYEHLQEINQSWNTPARTETINAIWPAIKPNTIDYGIMERAERVAVIPAADLGWNDVGSWESLFEVFTPDADGNIILNTEHIGVNTTNSLVVSDEDASRLVVTLGVEDIIVVDTNDAVLICSRNYAQKVREVVNLLKKREDKRYL